MKRKLYRLLRCQQIGIYNIWGYVTVCNSNDFVAMCRPLPDTFCEWASPLGAREGWPGTSAPCGDTRPQCVKIRKIKPNSGSVQQKLKSFHGDCGCRSLVPVPTASLLDLRVRDHNNCHKLLQIATNCFKLLANGFTEVPQTTGCKIPLWAYWVKGDNKQMEPFSIGEQ